MLIAQGSSDDDVAFLMFLVAVLILVSGGGFLAGFRAWLRRNDPKTICGCEHHLSYHDLEMGHCNALAEITRYDGDDERTVMTECRCKTYTGDLTADLRYLQAQRMLEIENRKDLEQ